ncbi:MAG: metallopeptidase family protein [Actinomycetota bacterium]|nr:metallopeptidase family protein [Actinomycetota bacterium]
MSATFEEVVAQALDDLPRWVRERLENVDVIIEDRPQPAQRDLLGLYEGIPLTQRGTGYSGVLPDRITLFQPALERAATSEGHLKALIRHTVVHEVAHFFGISDERLDDLGRY